MKALLSQQIIDWGKITAILCVATDLTYLLYCKQLLNHVCACGLVCNIRLLEYIVLTLFFVCDANIQNCKNTVCREKRGKHQAPHTLSSTIGCSNLVEPILLWPASSTNRLQFRSVPLVVQNYCFKYRFKCICIVCVFKKSVHAGCALCQGLRKRERYRERLPCRMNSVVEESGTKPFKTWKHSPSNHHDLSD